MFEKVFTSLVIISSLLLPLVPMPATAIPSHNIVINQVVAGSSDSASQELVQLYNDGDSPVDVTDWELIFVSSSSVTKKLAKLDGSIGEHGFMLLTSSNFVLPTGIVNNVGFPDSSLTYSGHLKLEDQAGDIVDLVGWGSAIEYEGAAIGAMSGGKVIHRYVDCDGRVVDADDNSQDMFIDQDVVYGSLTTATKDVCAAAVSHIDCENIIVTEILPNPEGSDAGNEYIEIYNPTSDNINLLGCGISLNGTGTFDFGSENIAPNEYMAFYDTSTGITLPNSAGGTVAVYSPGSENDVVYPGDLGENVAWALISGVWQETNQPTPSTQNISSLIESGGQGADELESCPAGKYRNPETNRCKTIETNDSQPCDPGQERNPDTNRCRKISSTGASLTPCDPGQERNPETNRCRKVAGASTLTPCQPGYERNPDTNRCRKVSGATSASDALANTAVAGQSPVSYPVLGVTTAAALGYGVFEYKHDIRNWFARLRKH